MPDFAELILLAHTESLEKGHKALDKLKVSADKADAASAKMTASTQKLNSGVSRAAPAISKTAKSTNELAIASAKAERALGLMNPNIKGVMRTLANGGKLRMTAVQLGQVTQQMAAGTSAARALSIQLPDLLLPFGTLGAVAGVAAGALAPVITGMLSTKDAAEQMKGQVAVLTEAVALYREHASLASSSTEDLRETFGESAEDARKMGAALMGFARVEALEDMKATVDLLSESYGGLTQEMERVKYTSNGTVVSDNFAEVPEVINTMNALKTELGLTGEQAQKVVEGLGAISSASDSAELVTAAKNLAVSFKETFNVLNDSTEEMKKVPGPLRAIAVQAGEIATQTGVIKSQEELLVEKIKEQNRLADQMIEKYRQQTEMQTAIARYGKDSAQVEELKRQAAMATAESYIEQRGLTGEIAQRVRDAATEAYNAEQGAAAAASSLRDAEDAARGLASAIAAATGFSASLDNNIRVLEAEIAALEAGADAAVAKHVELRRIRSEELRDKQIMAGQDRVLADAEFALTQVSIAQEGEKMARVKELTAARRASGRAAKKSAKSIKTAQQSILEGMKREIRERSYLLGLTNKERKEYEAILGVQKRLGKEAKTVSKAQIQALAGQITSLDQAEERLERIADLQNQWSENITRTAFEGGSLGEVVNGILRDIAYQFASAKIVLPVIASVTGFLGLGQLAIGGVAQTAASGVVGGTGASIAGGLAGSFLPGVFGAGGAIQGIGSGLTGVLSGGGLGSSFANLGGLLSGSTGGFGAIGAALPAVGLIAGAAAIIAKGLSREYFGTALRGTLGTGGFDGTSFDFYKGGFLRGDKTVYSSVPEEIQALLDNTMDATTDSIENMAASLGLGTGRLADYVSDEFTLWINGLDEAGIQEKLNEQLGIASDEMAALVLGTSEYNRAGEGALDTLTRLSRSLETVNGALELLGHTAYVVGLETADMASDLSDRFGSLEAMNSAVDTYFQAFYTERERSEAIARRLSGQFEDLGVAMPASREQFRRMIESIDLTSEAGRDMYAQLMVLSGGLDQVLPQIGQFSQEVQEMIRSVDTQVNGVLSSARDNARISQQSAQLWFRTATTLRGFLSDLLNTNLTAASTEQRRNLNRTRFETAFQMARQGDTDAARDLPKLARALLDSERAYASTSADYRKTASLVQAQVKTVQVTSDLYGTQQDRLYALHTQQVQVLTQLQQYLQSDSVTAEGLAQFQDALGQLDVAITDTSNAEVRNLVVLGGTIITASDSVGLAASRFSVTGREVGRTVGAVGDQIGLSLRDFVTGMGGLAPTMGGLRSSLDDLRASVDAAERERRAQRERERRIAEIADMARREAALADESRGWINLLIGHIESLEARTGVELRNGSRDATLALTDAGLQYRATSVQYGNGSDLSAFNAAFRGATGYEARLRSAGQHLAVSNTRLEELRQQIRALGGVPSFSGGGGTGNGARAGGIDGMGGFFSILHPRERIIDETDGGLVAELRALRAELAGMRSEQRQLGIKFTENTRKVASIARRWDKAGIPQEA